MLSLFCPARFGVIFSVWCFATNAHLKLLDRSVSGKGNGKFFYGQEPPSGESTTTECGVDYQLLAVMY